MGALVAWILSVMVLASWALRSDDGRAKRAPPLAASNPNIVVSPSPPKPQTSSIVEQPEIVEPDVEPDNVEPEEEEWSVASASLVSAARARVVADAAQPAAEEGNVSAAPVVEHAALQDAAVELLTSQSACTLQTASRSQQSARASSVYRGTDGLERHGPSHAFDGDAATFFHSACGLPHAPWWLSFSFDAPTPVATIRLTADAPADYPRAWELQGRADARSPFTTVLRVSDDPGISCTTTVVGGASARRHEDGAFTCDEPQTRSYEVRRPGDYVEYRLLIHTVSNKRRADRNCFRLHEMGFLGPCASSSLVLHLDAAGIEEAEGSLVREWRDQSGHGHHARARR